MPIYAKSTAALMRQFVAEHPRQDQFTADEIVSWFRINWPKIKQSTVQAHLTRMSMNLPSRIHLGAKPEDDLVFRIRPGLFRRYRPGSDPAPIYPGSPRAAVSEAESVVELDDDRLSPEQSGVFAYESHLRDYLAHNLGVLELGLRLYEEEGIPGIEYPMRNRWIDLLAVGQDGSLVVIELKVSRGHDRTIGQILTYMGWVRQDLAEGKPVRGMIVANTLSDELVTAAREANANIRLFEYDISFHVRPKS